MGRVTVASIVVAAAMTAAVPAMGAETVFVPQADQKGSVLTRNSTDGYTGSRGIVFKPTSDFTLLGVALYQDLTNVALSYTLRTVQGAGTNVATGTTLVSGSRTVTTNSLEFVEFTLDALTLVAGERYHLAFTLGGASNQNFFYREGSTPIYSTPGFTGVDGTSAYSTTNAVAPRIRLIGSAVTTAVPEPATWAMMIAGFAVVGGTMRRQRRTTASVRFA